MLLATMQLNDSSKRCKREGHPCELARQASAVLGRAGLAGNDVLRRPLNRAVNHEVLKLSGTCRSPVSSWPHASQRQVLEAGHGATLQGPSLPSSSQKVMAAGMKQLLLNITEANSSTQTLANFFGWAASRPDECGKCSRPAPKSRSL